MEKKFNDEVIYITGASAGIGFTTAQESLKNGATVVITGRDKAKLDAIVCSAQEVSIVKKVFKKEIITPGIRFNKKANDQVRVLTPKEAYKNGSDWLVLGRPITKGNIKKNFQSLIDHLNQ